VRFALDGCDALRVPLHGRSCPRSFFSKSAARWITISGEALSLRTFPDRNGEVDMTQPALPPNLRRRVLMTGAEALSFLGLALYSVSPLPVLG
jgi:hypothetical protein